MGIDAKEIFKLFFKSNKTQEDMEDISHYVNCIDWMQLFSRVSTDKEYAKEIIKDIFTEKKKMRKGKK